MYLCYYSRCTFCCLAWNPSPSLTSSSMLLPSSFIGSTVSLAAPATSYHATSKLFFTATSSSRLFSMISCSSVLQKIALPVALSIARGGGVASELFSKHSNAALDMGRVRLRLEGLQSYATLCALLTNGCLRLYSSVKVPKQQQSGDSESPSRGHTMALDAFLFCIVFSVLFGSYTTIVFTLLVGAVLQNGIGTRIRPAVSPVFCSDGGSPRERPLSVLFVFPSVV